MPNALEIADFLKTHGYEDMKVIAVNGDDLDSGEWEVVDVQLHKSVNGDAKIVIVF